MTPPAPPPHRAKAATGQKIYEGSNAQLRACLVEGVLLQRCLVHAAPQEGSPGGAWRLGRQHSQRARILPAAAAAPASGAVGWGDCRGTPPTAPLARQHARQPPCPGLPSPQVEAALDEVSQEHIIWQAAGGEAGEEGVCHDGAAEGGRRCWGVGRWVGRAGWDGGGAGWVRLGILSLPCQLAGGVKMLRSPFHGHLAAHGRQRPPAVYQTSRLSSPGALDAWRGLQPPSAYRSFEL